MERFQIIRSGDLVRLKEAIDRGFDINSSTGYDDDRTLLEAACESEQLACVAFLLEHGADPYGFITCHCYVSTKSTEIKALLLRHGFDPLRSNYKKHTLQRLRYLAPLSSISTVQNTVITGTYVEIEYLIENSPSFEGAISISITIDDEPPISYKL